MINNKKQIILVGGGGHCKACIDVIESEKLYQIKGILDLPERIGDSVLLYKIIGTDKDISKFANEGYSFLITVGQIKSSAIRERLYSEIKRNNGNLPVIISPNSYVAKSAKIGEGTIIMHHVLINTEAQVGVNCIINNKVLIEHESTIGNHCHISTNSVINGQCKIGKSVFIGSSSLIYNNINISDHSIIAGGTVISTNINSSGLYWNNLKTIKK